MNKFRPSAIKNELFSILSSYEIEPNIYSPNCKNAILNYFSKLEKIIDINYSYGTYSIPNNAPYEITIFAWVENRKPFFIPITTTRRIN